MMTYLQSEDVYFINNYISAPAETVFFELQYKPDLKWKLYFDNMHFDQCNFDQME